MRQRRYVRRRRSLGAAPRRWWDKAPPKRDKLCYQTKTEALNAFLDTNWQIIENYSGAGNRESPAEFDAVNQKYGLVGKRAARSIAEAVWAVMPKGRPFCLDKMDLEALNDTSPAREAGQNFRLPDYAYEAKMAAEEEAYYREAYGLGLKRRGLAGFSGYHMKRARQFEREAEFKLTSSRANAMARRCAAAIEDFREGAQAAGKADVNAWDSKDYTLIQRVTGLEKRLRRAERAIIVACFVKP